MNAHQDKKGIPWLLTVFGVIAVSLLLINVLNTPSHEGNGVAPLTEADLSRESPQDGSKDPLYFRVVFGDDDANSMLGKVEASGAGTGYDVAYMDENNNGDLMDDLAKPFPRIEHGSRSGQLDPRIEFSGLLKGAETATYRLSIYSLTRGSKANTGAGDYYYHWNLDSDQWHYFFINGKMRLSASVVEARKAPPVRLGGPCKWDIRTSSKDGTAMVSAGLKDENGCTLRVVSQDGDGKDITPRLSLTKDGKIELEQAMEFG